MRKKILWLLLAAFICSVALEAASPWTPARGRSAIVAKKKKTKKRHKRKHKKKKRKHRRKRKLAEAPAAGTPRAFAV